MCNMSSTTLQMISFSMLRDKLQEKLYRVTPANSVQSSNCKPKKGAR